MADEVIDDLLIGKAIALTRFANGLSAHAEEVAIVSTTGNLLALARPSLDGELLRPRKVFVKREA